MKKDGMLLQPSTGGVHRSGHASKAACSVLGGQPPGVPVQLRLYRQSHATILSMAVTCHSQCQPRHGVVGPSRLQSARHSPLPGKLNHLPK